VSERLRVRGIDDDEGQRLVRIIRRGSGSVVTWRQARMVLLSAQGMDVPAIAKAKPGEYDLPFSTWRVRAAEPAAQAGPAVGLNRRQGQGTRPGASR
jgi:hypothetical protein